uniref:Uncharacterized protein n=1 Tax=Trichogramma kaykai TaxID=54128 RepID=A0ABD2X3R0_9HYME
MTKIDETRVNVFYPIARASWRTSEIDAATTCYYCRARIWRGQYLFAYTTICDAPATIKFIEEIISDIRTIMIRVVHLLMRETHAASRKSVSTNLLIIRLYKCFHQNIDMVLRRAGMVYTRNARVRLDIYSYTKTQHQSVDETRQQHSGAQSIESYARARVIW